MLLLSLTLTGCADSDADRRFANDPMPTEDIAAAPTVAPTTVQVAPKGEDATPIPQELLVAYTGPAQARFSVRERDVLAVSLDGSQPARIATLEREPLAMAPSADGTLLALLVPTGAASELLILGADGTERFRSQLPASNDFATPGPAEPMGRNEVAWSNDGTRLIVSAATGGIVEVGLDGESRVLLDASQAPSPRSVDWSPGGGAIAFVDAGPAGDATALYVASTDALPIDPVVVIRPSLSGARQIADIEWVGGEAGILFSQRAEGDDLSLGGDLFAVQPSGGAPRLVAAAGGASEVGVIGEFSGSADGQVVAYTVLGVVNGEPGFVGLWIQQVDGPASVEVQTRPWDRVGGLVWTVTGLTWQAGQGEGIAVERLSSTGSVTSLFEDGIAATPVASPVASPIASPAVRE